MRWKPQDFKFPAITFVMKCETSFLRVNPSQPPTPPFPCPLQTTGWVDGKVMVVSTHGSLHLPPALCSGTDREWNLLWTVINVHNIDIALSPSSHFYSQSLQARHVCTAINFTDLEVSPLDEFSARWNECRVANSLSLHGGVLMPLDWRRRKLGLHSVWVYSRMHRVVFKYLLLWTNKDENHFQLFFSFKLMNELSLSGEDVFAI